MTQAWPHVRFAEFLRPNKRPYTLGPTEDANLLGMRLYGGGPFHREFKPATKIRKKTHFVVRTGDVIYNKLFAWKGTFGIVPPDFDGMFVSDKFPTYELDCTRVDARFLSWYFQYPLLWEQARKKSVGSAALSKLTLNPPRFMHLTIPLPKLPEQKRIVAKIEELSTRLEEAKVLRTGAKRDAGLVLTAVLHSVAARFPSLGRLEEVLIERPRNGWSARCDNADDGVPVLTLGAVTGYHYQPANHKRTSLATDATAHYWLQAGDLLVTRSNTPELVGHAAIYDGRPHPCIYPDLMMRVPVDAARADTRFVWYWLRCPIVRRYVGRKSKGTSPTMKKIGQRTVMDIPFPTDLSPREQRVIVQRLDALQARLEVLEALQSQTGSHLVVLSRSILDKAFKGEL